MKKTSAQLNSENASVWKGEKEYLKAFLKIVEFPSQTYNLATWNLIDWTISTKRSLIQFHFAWALVFDGFQRSGKILYLTAILDSVKVCWSYECWYWNPYIPVQKREMCPSWLYSAIQGQNPGSESERFI